MIHDSQESRAYVEHLLSEHRRVHGLLQRMQQQWALTPEGPSHANRIQELCASAQVLRDELTRHFSEEECGGVLDEAAARCPDLGRDQRRLVDEHTALLYDLGKIIGGLQTAGKMGLLPSDLRQSFHQFVERLKAHETRENRLVEKGFGVEIN